MRFIASSISWLEYSASRTPRLRAKPHNPSSFVACGSQKSLTISQITPSTNMQQKTTSKMFRSIWRSVISTFSTPDASTKSPVSKASPHAPSSLSSSGILRTMMRCLFGREGSSCQQRLIRKDFISIENKIVGAKMVRRKPYTKVDKTNQIRAEHVRGMGDTVFKGFQCLNSECQEFIFVR